MSANRVRPTAHSATALSKYLACPAQYAFEYVEGVEVEEERSPALFFGGVVHRVMAYLYGLPVENRGAEVAHQALRHFWAGADRSVFGSTDEEVAWGVRGLTALSDYCATHDLSIRPLVREDFIRTRLPNGRVISGKVDRVDPFGPENEGIEVIDYKTGACRVDEADMPNELAVRLYAVACQRRYRRPVLRVRYIYLVEGVDRRWDPEQEDLAEFERELCELTELLQLSPGMP